MSLAQAPALPDKAYTAFSTTIQASDDLIPEEPEDYDEEAAQPPSELMV